jgi:hypothetical protein
VGSTSQLTATATLSNGSTQTVTTQATWQSSNAAVLTVSASGLAAGVAPGDADVVAKYEGSNGSLHLSVAPRTYGLTGVIADETTRAALAEVRVEVLNGTNAGKTASTDMSGTYRFAGLLAETFRLRASKEGFAAGEQNVTVPEIPRADFFLHQPCSITVSPTSYSQLNVPYDTAEHLLTVTAAPSTCTWNVSTSDDWIKFAPPTTGTGSSTVTFHVLSPEPVTVLRTGAILVSSAGASTRIPTELRPASCTSGTVAVPADGAGYGLWNIGEGCFLNTTLTVDVPWIHGGQRTSGGGLYLVDIYIDPNTGAQRIGHITMDGHGNGLYAQHTFVQANP